MQDAPVPPAGRDASQRARALVASACSRDLRRARALLDADPALAGHDMACACVAGNREAVERILEHSPVAAREPAPPLDREPILYACFSRYLRADPQRAAGIRAVAGLLLDAGADPNASFDHEGWLQVPVYGAAGIANDAQLTRMLLEAGADPNDGADADCVGEALYHACEFPDPECARLLIDAGTRQHVVDYCLGRALNFPHAEMVEMFCAHGARASAGHLHQAAWRRRPPRTVRALLDAGAPIDEPDEHGLTSLQIATRWGEGEVAALLVARGADSSTVTGADRALGEFMTGRGGTAPADDRLDVMLQLAVEGGHPEAVGRALDAGAPIDGRPPSEEVPLGHAAWRGYVDVVALLVARGAKLTFDGGGSAVGAALHGSRHCHHPEGGPTMRPIDEIPQAPYAGILRLLFEAGAPLPPSLADGTPTASLLADLGVPAPA